MATSRKSQRGNSGGRTAGSEPRLQVFKEFNGINFEHVNRADGDISVDHRRDDQGDQTDLQMNFVFLQNNVATVSNKTMEVRDDIVTLFDAPADVDFTGPVCLIGPNLYVAKSDDSIGIANLDDRHNEGSPIVVDTDVTLDNKTGSHHTWSDFDYYDDKLIAQTSENEMWIGDTDSNWVVTTIANAIEIPDPTENNIGVSQTGDLVISNSATAECPYRIELAYTYVNKFGPTKMSPVLIFYANHPVTEWHHGCFPVLADSIPSGRDITAVELYYSTDNAMQMLFLDRVDIPSGDTGWTYDWYGYIDTTSMWTIGNLIAPTENYTKGVHASRVCNIDGRMYFWGDSDEPQRLYIGGNPGNLFSISPGTGGGFVDVEPGTSQSVRHVCKYKTQSGNSIVTMLCDSPNSHREQRFNLVETDISISNEQNMKAWNAEQVAGAVGCKSYDGVVVCQDGLYSVSRYGLALTTMTMEYNSQIKTTYVSDPIKPVFTDAANMETRLSNAMVLECDGVIYMAMGTASDEKGNLDNVIFCYDIDLKAWWTYTLDVDSPILRLFHVDWQGQREGIGIVTERHIYMLPTTASDEESTEVNHSFLIETAQLSTQMPQQGWQYLSQLEFHFDYIIGDVTIDVRMVDMFGREIKVRKVISEESEQFDYTTHMRIDQRVMSYVIIMTGQARFRLTHFIARVYTLSNKISQVWGFDDSISHRSSGSVHPTFKCYNDVRRAIFT